MIFDLKEQLIDDAYSMSSAAKPSNFSKVKANEYNETHVLNDQEIEEAIEQNDFDKMKLRFKKI